MGWERRITWALWLALAAVVVAAFAALAGSGQSPPLGERIRMYDTSSTSSSTSTTLTPSSTSTPTGPERSTSTPRSTQHTPKSSVVDPPRAPVRVPVGEVCDDDECDGDDDD